MAGKKFFTVDEEGNPIKIKVKTEKHFIVDEEGKPKKYKKKPPEKYWLSGMRRFNRGGKV